MALFIGKLTIVAGAAIVGSVLAKEGRMPTVSDVFSGAYKVFFKQLRHDDTKTPGSKPRSDALIAEVNNLRQELQLVASNRPITIVTSSGSGSGKYGIIIVVVVLGYGYVWWKGWRLSDMRFATKRCLSDACNAVGIKLDNVHATIAKTERDVSSRLDLIDSTLNECLQVSTATQEEASELGADAQGIVLEMESFRHVLEDLETKVNRCVERQDIGTAGVVKLLEVAHSSPNTRTTHRIQGGTSSTLRPAMEMPSRTASLPPLPSAEPPSPSKSNKSLKVQKPLHRAAIATGLKEIYGTSGPSEQLSKPTPSNGVHIVEETSNGVSGSGLLGGRFSGISASFFTRSVSAVQSSK